MPSSESAPARSSDDGLRQRLIATTVDAVDAVGVTHVSMRSVTRELGVSHTAPLRHFSGFADLLAEVAAVGFDELRRRAERASEAVAVGAGAVERLTEACQAYVAFAVDRPELFALMFRPDVLAPTNARYVASSRAAHRAFARLVLHAQDAGLASDVATAEANAAVWSMVHGLAVLWTSGPLRDTLAPGTERRDVVARAVGLLVRARPPLDQQASAGVSTRE